MSGPVAALLIGVEVVDELGRPLQIARGGELPAELVRRLTLVGEPQGVSDGFPGNAVSAALVAEQVAPAAGPRHSAARIASPSNRSGAGDQRNPGGELRRGKDELSVVDDFDRGAGETACDQLPQPARISVRPQGRYTEIIGYEFRKCSATSAAASPAASAGSIPSCRSDIRGSGFVTSAPWPARTSAIGGGA